MEASPATTPRKMAALSACAAGTATARPASEAPFALDPALAEVATLATPPATALPADTTPPVDCVERPAADARAWPAALIDFVTAGDGDEDLDGDESNALAIAATPVDPDATAPATALPADATVPVDFAAMDEVLVALDEIEPETPLAPAAAEARLTEDFDDVASEAAPAAILAPARIDILALQTH